MFKKSFFTLLFISSLFAQQVDILYDIRVPYVLSNKNTISGFTASPVTQALKKSKLNYHLLQIPTKRQLAMIQSNTSAICGIGWFKKAEREKFAKFTNPLYQDQASIFITRARDSRFSLIYNSDALLKKKNLKLLIKEDFSYGKYIDDKLTKYQPTTVKTLTNNMNMLNMIKTMRADYMFMSYEEAYNLFESDQSIKDKLTIRYLTDIPKGNKRYLMCSKKVSDEFINKFNAGLE
jgi:uncharacterized protein (TIGR02285 family)